MTDDAVRFVTENGKSKTLRPQEFDLTGIFTRDRSGRPATVTRNAPLPDPGRLWIVTHRALRNVPRVAAVWSFLEGQIQAWP